MCPSLPPFLSTRRPELHAHCPLNLESQPCWAAGGWGGRLFFFLFKRYTRGGCSFAKACRGDLFGWLGRLAEKIHQPASSTLTSPNHVLICQSVGFLYVYSSVFVSGEIAFVFLCLLLNPSVDLWPPHATYLVSSLEIELGAVVTPKGKQPKKLNPGFLYPPPPF